jgi:site-specific DNA recombinase
VNEFHQEETEKSHCAAAALNARYRACLKELDELVNIRLKGLLSDDEFLAKKRELENERFRLKESLEDNDGRFSDVLDRSIETFEFAYSARSKFKAGTAEQKRAILSVVGLNPVLYDGILLIDAQKPFRGIQEAISGSSHESGMYEPPEFGQHSPQNGSDDMPKDKWWRVVDDVRTYFSKKKY